MQVQALVKGDSLATTRIRLAKFSCFLSRNEKKKKTGKRREIVSDSVMMNALFKYEIIFSRENSNFSGKVKNGSRVITQLSEQCKLKTTSVSHFGSVGLKRNLIRKLTQLYYTYKYDMTYFWLVLPAFGAFSWPQMAVRKTYKNIFEEISWIET